MNSTSRTDSTATEPRGTTGEYLRSYERVFYHNLSPEYYTVIRVDGRAFSTFTRGMHKPFDPGFTDAMNVAAEALAAEVSGALAVYVASDEVSVIIRHYRGSKSQPWMGGEHSKMVSLSAATATAHFNDSLRRAGTFDSRVFMLPTELEVMDYLAWRQRDTFRNAVAMICDAFLGKKVTVGKKIRERIEMLEAAGISLDQFSARNLHGRMYHREIVRGDIEYRDKRTGELRVAHDVERRVWTYTEDRDEMRLRLHDDLLSLSLS